MSNELETNILIAKNRNGKTGMINLVRDPNFTTFKVATEKEKMFTFSESRREELKWLPKYRAVA